MYRTILKSEIRSATVTHTYLHPVGSLTIDALLLEAADILPGELVSIVDITNGARLESHAVSGAPHTGVLGFDGAAAHLVRAGDLVSIASYASIADDEAKTFRPRIVHVDASNNVVKADIDTTHAHDLVM